MAATVSHHFLLRNHITLFSEKTSLPPQQKRGLAKIGKNCLLSTYIHPFTWQEGMYGIIIHRLTIHSRQVIMS